MTDKQRTTIVERILSSGVIAVIRLESPHGLVETARALAAGGVAAVEVTMTTPGALEVIAQARQLGPDALIGAGTVLTPEQAGDAIRAGAAFIVAPTLDPEVLRLAHDADVPYIPGALTPNEVCQAMRVGADLIKLFPGRVATPGYFKDILGPFPTAKLLPTGNVDLTTLPEYIKSGAVAVGVGKALIDPSAIQRAEWGSITARATEFSLAVRAARKELS